jgi:nucleoside-diphosphate-sugar epimerase
VEDDLVELADADFVPVSMRNATAFGFSPRLRADIVLNNLVGHALLTNTVKVLSDGTPWRPLAHAEDIAQAVVAALVAPADVVRGRAYNIGTERNNRTVAEIAEAVVEAVPGAGLLITGEAGNDPRSYRVDFSRARKELGFEAQWSIPEGAQQLAQEYRARGLTQEAFDRRFTRLAVLSARAEAGELDPTMRPVRAR